MQVTLNAQIGCGGRMQRQAVGGHVPQEQVHVPPGPGPLPVQAGEGVKEATCVQPREGEDWKGVEHHGQGEADNNKHQGCQGAPGRSLPTPG